MVATTGAGAGAVEASGTVALVALHGAIWGHLVVAEQSATMAHRQLSWTAV